MNVAQIAWVALTTLLLVLATILAFVDTDIARAVCLIFLFFGCSGYVTLVVMLLLDRRAE